MAKKHKPPPATPDRMDGYMPLAGGPVVDARVVTMDQVTLDGFRNQLTGIGDPSLDKTLGGNQQGVLPFDVRLLSGWECANRWRGSDLGAKIVETIPNEMTREGWKVQVQPTDELADSSPGAKRKDALERLDAGAAAKLWESWGEHWAARGRGDVQHACHQLARAWAKVDAEGGPPPPYLTPPPQPRQPLPETDKEGPAQVEKLETKAKAIGVRPTFKEAANYERAYGGACVLIGIDDSGGPPPKPLRLDDAAAAFDATKVMGTTRLDADDERNMTRPLDETRIKSIRHLTAFRGGWDGEAIAWRYYNNPMHPRYGEPEIYMIRNLGVPLATPMAPGEASQPAAPIVGNTTGALIFFVHESRLLVFPGVAVDRLARVQMRGWGDSIFTRVDEVLTQFGQTWGAVANLMTDWAQGVLKIAGLAANLASNDPTKDGALAKRMLMINMGKSVARTFLIDEKEEFKREVTPLSGIAEVLQQFAYRLAAAAGLPIGMLMGQMSAGGLNKGDAEVRFFYDQVKAQWNERMYPQLHRLYRLMWLAKDSPTGGVEPARWDIEPSPLWQPTEKEQAETRYIQAQTDHIYVQDQVLEPAEVTVSRFGGAAYSYETIIDLEGRAAMAALDAERASRPPELPPKPGDPATPPPTPPPPAP